MDFPSFLTVPPPIPSVSEIIPGLYISGRISQPQVATAHHKHRIASVLSLVNKPDNTWQQKGFRETILSGHHLWIQSSDDPAEDLLKSMEECCNFIDEFLPTTTLPKNKKSSGTNSTTPSKDSVLVHCNTGISRSATIVIAYLMRKEGKPFQDVFAQVRRKRPEIDPSAEFKTQLEIWEKSGHQIWKHKAQYIPKTLYSEYLEKQGGDSLTQNGLEDSEDFLEEEPIASRKRPTYN